GIGDVGDVELVKADKPTVARRARGQRGERILGALQLVELAVHLAHEVMKMHAALANEGHAEEKRVHEKALAAPHRPPEINALGERWLHEKPLQRARAPRLVGAPLLEELLQALDRAPLRRVGLNPPLRQTLPVKRDNILGHGTLAMRSRAVRSSSVRSVTGRSLVVSTA